MELLGLVVLFASAFAVLYNVVKHELNNTAIETVADRLRHMK